MPEAEPLQKQSVDHCAELREDCRDGIFTEMRRQHGETLTALRKIEVAVARMEGRTDSGSAIPKARRLPLREMVTLIAVVAVAVASAIVAARASIDGAVKAAVAAAAANGKGTP
jgi:hypothetical protein